MPYRPTANHRKNVRGVIYPLTEAIRRLYGMRQSDGSYPLGAFYTINISNTVWRSVGGIWYIPQTDLDCRNPREEVVSAFINSIHSGESVELPSGKVITWEQIPNNESAALPHHQI
ncbi:hypothetical protein [uncultured Shewanella sp.]|uniref:hypothetical protein n=1 Tax=uncultured Shewanella sp. TaxID=173975 RepID=UPI0026147511|nr:hypothetical protein [uncultured Shewanella sp.]